MISDPLAKPLAANDPENLGCKLRFAEELSMRVTTRLLGLAFLALPGGGAAQDKPDITAPTAEKCEWALGLLESSEASPQRREALELASICGPEGGAALAAELRRLRTMSDTVELRKVYFEIARIRDAQIYRAALEVGGDPQATVESRIVAFKLLISYAKIGFVSAPFAAFYPDEGAGFGTQSHFGRHEGRPLPPNWKGETLALLERLATDPAESDTIQTAAIRSQWIFRE